MRPRARDAVLRTGTREDEPGTTPAATAAADEQTPLFAVDKPAAKKPTRSLAVVERKELAQANAGHAVAAWCEGYAESHDAKPTARQIGQVGREARHLFEAGNAPERVIAAARSAGRRGFATVEKEHNALAKRTGAPASEASRRPSATSRATQEAQALKAQFPQIANGGAA